MTLRGRDRRAITPQGRGRFPGFDVLDQAPIWDEVTTGVVLARLAPPADLSFFTAVEEGIATALCDLLLAQDREPKIPVVALLDTRLAAGETDGWHFDDMPEDGEAWRRTLAFLNIDARDRHGQPFARLGRHQQAKVVQAVSDAEVWHGLPGKQVWSLWTRYACTAFYSHPWSWNEIGFSGPAYPRGYKNLGLDGSEPWEVDDQNPADPESFARRVEAAHTNHADLIGQAPDDT
jgi:hypothetical protein